MKIQDSLFSKLIDFLIDIKFNAGLFCFGAFLGQGQYLPHLKAWIQEYIFSDFTFGQFFLIMLICKFIVKIARGIRKQHEIDFQKEFYDLLTEIVVYGCLFVAVHGIANFTIDGLRQEEFNTIPRVILGGCMIIEFKNVFNAAGLNLSKIIDEFTEFIKKFKSKKDE